MSILCLISVHISISDSSSEEKGFSKSGSSISDSLSESAAELLVLRMPIKLGGRTGPSDHRGSRMSVMVQPWSVGGEVQSDGYEIVSTGQHDSSPVEYVGSESVGKVAILKGQFFDDWFIVLPSPTILRIMAERTESMDDNLG